MENAEAAPTKVLDIGKVNHNKWTKPEYENLKKARGMAKSIRGSQLVRDVISNLKIKRGQFGGSFSLAGDNLASTNYNSIYQRHYGESFANYLEKHKTSFKHLITLRKSRDSKELLDIRARMVDWMIEVFTVYASKGANEYTYFKAVIFLDTLINMKVISEDNIHIYGIAVMYLASNILDFKPMSINEAFQDLGHQAFKEEHILKYVNKTIERLEFNFRMPTWIEYLDKVIFDAFGDYREAIEVFNIRQTAVFVLHACAFDVKYYAWEPFLLATIALVYSINVYFTAPVIVQSEPGGVEHKQGTIIQDLLNQRKVNKQAVRQGLEELNIYLEDVKLKVRDSSYKQLSKIFNYDP